MDGVVGRIDWQLLFVRVYIYLNGVYEIVSKQTLKSARYLLASFDTELYYYVEGAYPPVQKMNTDTAWRAQKVFSYKYNRDDNLIQSLVDEECANAVASVPQVASLAHVANIIDAKIYVDNHIHYDITDFFDKTTYIGSAFPPLPVWIGFWSADKGIYLEPKINYKLHITSFEGENLVFSIWPSVNQEEGEKWKQVNTPLTLHRQPELEPTAEENDGACGENGHGRGCGLWRPSAQN